MERRRVKRRGEERRGRRRERESITKREAFGAINPLPPCEGKTTLRSDKDRNGERRMVVLVWVYVARVRGRRAKERAWGWGVGTGE